MDARRIWVCGGLLAIAAGWRVEPERFEPPGAAERARAVGPLAGAPAALRRSLDADGFEPIATPTPYDWLGTHWEPGQTFQDFSREGHAQPIGARRKLYLLPLEAGPAQAAAALLAEYAGIFFGVETAVLQGPPLDPAELAPRSNPRTGLRQLKTSRIFDALEERLPADAYALIAVTAEDLYPVSWWNFVFGQAKERDRVGVMSLSRLASGEGRPLLRRSLKLLTHETGHLFGLKHCIHFNCNLNGANDLHEADSQPLEVCPACLRKLHASAGFDPAARYRKLEDFFRRHGLLEDAAAASVRASFAEGPPCPASIPLVSAGRRGMVM